MLTDGYEDYCRDLVGDATNHKAPAAADLCACAELENKAQSDGVMLPKS